MSLFRLGLTPELGRVLVFLHVAAFMRSAQMIRAILLASATAATL